MRTPITYYGGKQRLVSELLPLIPVHRLYCEPFVGGGALFFAKPASQDEIINDINGEVVNFFMVMQAQFDQLRTLVQRSLHSRALHREAMEIYNNPGAHAPIKRAWAFWVVTNQGFSGQIGSWSPGRTSKMARALASKRDEFTTEYVDRLKHTQIEQGDATTLIKRYDGPDTFFYLDPPYYDSVCGHYKKYTLKDYQVLLETLSKAKGRFILSSYPSEILSQFIEKCGWNYKEIQQKISVTHRTQKIKTEVIVYNYPLEDAGFYNGTQGTPMRNYADKSKQKGAEKVQPVNNYTGATSLHMSVSLPYFGILRVKEAMARLKIKDVRTFKLWCKKHEVTIFNDVGGRYVYEEELNYKMMQPIIKEMKRKYPDKVAIMLPPTKNPGAEPAAISPASEEYMPQGKNEAKFLIKLQEIATKKRA